EILRPSPIPSWLTPPPAPPASRGTDPFQPSPQVITPSGQNRAEGADGDLVDRYRQAVEAQQRVMQGWQQP
ncbi:MAG: hypothetical protein WCI65_09625, partial [Synechococcaceae cyanobacterium ELA263]